VLGLAAQVGSGGHADERAGGVAELVEGDGGGGLRRGGQGRAGGGQAPGKESAQAHSPATCPVSSKT
jgi:hypothetical protein